MYQKQEIQKKKLKQEIVSKSGVSPNSVKAVQIEPEVYGGKHEWNKLL